MIYTVEIKEVLCRTIEVEAEDNKEALDAIERQYKKEEIVLDWNDFVDTKIEIV